MLFFFFLSFYRQLKPDFVERCYVNCVKWLLCVKLATYIFIGPSLMQFSVNAAGIPLKRIMMFYINFRMTS